MNYQLQINEHYAAALYYSRGTTLSAEHSNNFTYDERAMLSDWLNRYTLTDIVDDNIGMGKCSIDGIVANLCLCHVVKRS